MTYVLIIVAVLGSGAVRLTDEQRLYPFPNLATCEAVLKDGIAKRKRDPDTVVTKAVCEPLG